MAEKRQVFKPEFREEAVRIVTETGKPISEVADDLGINEATLASWVSRAKRAEKGKPAYMQGHCMIEICLGSSRETEGS
ncbi:transposase [Streptomyces sp. NPDC058394]|uniref:transposase n=1 Tax=Streptomyces sp. NPDC058394 TaxID=3346477 RepID=UPI00364AB023